MCGTNENGYPVFKNPSLAFITMQKDYKKALNRINRKFHIGKISQYNFSKYYYYSWGTSSILNDSDVSKVHEILNIYSNSFKLGTNEVNWYNLPS